MYNCLTRNRGTMCNALAGNDKRLAQSDVEGLTLGSRGVGTRAGLTSWGVSTTSRRVSMIVLVIMRLGGGSGSTAKEAEAPPCRRGGATSTLLVGLGVGRRASVGRAIFRNIKYERRMVSFIVWQS